MRLMVVAALLLAGLVLFQAQPCSADPTADAQNLANNTVHKGRSLIDQVGDGVGGAAKGIGNAAGAAGKGIGNAAGAVGRFIGEVASAIGAGAQAVVSGLVSVGGAMATGLSLGLAVIGEAAIKAVGAVGAVLAVAGRAASSGIAAAAGWLGAQLAFLAGLYGSFVASMRPKQMQPAVFQAVAASGAAATTGAAVYGLWALLKKLAWLTPFAGFTRIENSDLLEHPMRSQIFQVIQNNPGVHASELSRQVGAGWGTITHHLDKLEKGKLVTTRRVNNQKCYFEDGGKVSSQDMAVASAVRGDSAGQITSFVASHPMTSQKAMAGELGMSAALASFHVKKLVGVGVLEKIRRGKETLLTTTQAVRRVMQQPSGLEVPATLAPAIQA
ncbi:MAG: winged helix-turn-helix transcriptional regulator [bacterium]